MIAFQWLMRVVDSYKGSVVNDKTDGFGSCVWPSGFEYEGEWKDNKHNGCGKIKWPDGSTYEGECRGGAKIVTVLFHFD